jgi:hypothetical protein
VERGRAAHGGGARGRTRRARMSESLAQWLALREPFDVLARSIRLARVVAESLPREHVRVVDLGTGTGANVRYLAGLLPPHQRWLVVDKDPAVLADLGARMSVWLSQRPSVECETCQLDLGARGAPEIFEGCQLVTASALLDLVSAEFLDWLAAQCRASGAVALFALTYNGESHCFPEDPDDDTVRGLFNRHQRQSDKGFGPAAGPDAVRLAERAFVAAGYRVMRAPSDWQLAPSARTLQRELMQGWADAAREIAPGQSAAIADWFARRVAHLDAGRSRIIVCHEDLAAFPT